MKKIKIFSVIFFLITVFTTIFFLQRDLKADQIQPCAVYDCYNGPNICCVNYLGFGWYQICSQYDPIIVNG